MVAPPAGNGRREDSIACEVGHRDHDSNFDRPETVRCGDWGLTVVWRFVLDNVMYSDRFEVEKAEYFRCQSQDHCPWAVVNRVFQYASGTFGLSLKSKIYQSCQCKGKK